MARTFTEREALEAVTAALTFGRMGIARAAAEQEGPVLEDAYSGRYIMDAGARELLAKAHEISLEHGVALGMFDGRPLTEHDLRRAMDEYEDNQTL